VEIFVLLASPNNADLKKRKKSVTAGFQDNFGHSHLQCRTGVDGGSDPLQDCYCCLCFVAAFCPWWLHIYMFQCNIKHYNWRKLRS